MKDDRSGSARPHVGQPSPTVGSSARGNVGQPETAVGSSARGNVGQPSPAVGSSARGNVGQPSPAVGSAVRLAKPALAEYRRKLPHYQRPGATLFITFVTADRWILPEPARQIVIETCLVGHQQRFFLHALVVMPDHVHILLSPMRDTEGSTYGIAEIMSAIKGASAHAINRQLGRRGRVWQSESFDHVLRNDESLRQKAEYICQNPVRAGIVGDEDQYRWIWREWIEGPVVE